MDVPFLRTADSRFQNLPNFPYKPHYLNNGKLRMAYIDETVNNGGNTQETFLCLHGQPTWSYLYRKMIPIFLSHTTKDQPTSRRVLAPDLFGFGRSDKPTDESVYTFGFHRASLLHFIRSLNLQNVTLVVQDWGGILGLTLPLEETWRFSRLIVMNTSIVTGQTPGKGFEAWRAYVNRTPDLDVGALMKRSFPQLSPAEKDAYNAPYPDARYKSGVRRFPNLVMTDPGMEGVEVSERAVEMYQASDQFKAEDVFMAVGVEDAVFGVPVMKALSKVWKNGCFVTHVQGAGHFVQEWGDQVALKAINLFENPSSAVDGVTKGAPREAKI